MLHPSAELRGVIHGKRIELESEPGLPDGQHVTVEIRAVDEAARWLERLAVDSSVGPGKLVVKGTRLLADDLAGLVEAGRTDEELLAQYPDLTAEDVAAIRQYALVPLGVRRAFGGWAEDADEIDRFVEWTYRRRTATGIRPES